MNVVHDDTMVVAGFEHQTFMCSSCHDVEQRLVFVRAEEPIPATQSIASEQGGSGAVPSRPDTTPTIKPMLFDEHAVVPQDAPVIGVQDEPAFAVQKPVVAFQDATVVGGQNGPAYAVLDEAFAIQEEHAVAVQDAPPIAGQDEPAAAPGNERAATATIFTRVVARLRGR